MFKKASGTLKPTKLNMISYIFYLFILQSYIGASLTFLGMKKHYLILKILNESTINKTYYMVAYTAIVFPLAMYLVSRLVKVDIGILYDNYLSDEIQVGNKYEDILILIICFICILSVVYTFMIIGYVPLIDMLFHSDSKRFLTDRIILANKFSGNAYIKNILAMTFTPIMSYVTYVYAKVTKDKKWIIMFLIMLACSVLMKTYDYSKSPLAFYIVGFIFLNIIINKVIDRKKLIMFLLAGVVVIVAMYIKMGYYFNTGIHIYNGPLGRVFFTQVATLFLHVDVFPKYLPFLNGRSFYPSILKLLRIAGPHVRSGKVVMAFYNPEGVFNGVAGVMNSLFIGEAYANFGIKGALLAPIYVGILLEAIYIIFLKIKKSPVNIGIFCGLALYLGNATQGGFFDFIYSSSILSIILLLLLIYASNYILSKVCKN